MPLPHALVCEKSGCNIKRGAGCWHLTLSVGFTLYRKEAF